MLKLYNTLTRKKENFKPLKKGKVGMYSCGPTVYGNAHIGNMRTYVFADILRRVLEFEKYKVKQVMNITDVGHLTSDRDEGEDKLQKSAKEQKTTAWEISQKYTKQFLEDLSKLNIQPVKILCKATDHIPEQIALIKKLEKRGYTYITSDGVYFDASKFPKYRNLAKLNIKGLQAGQRIGMGEKKNKIDFALWKFSKPKENRDMEWKSPWGKGFPGWHIECSAMSMKYLGETFDIHTGGVDHIPVHHTNEIAQSEAATGKKFVKYWLHSGFLTMKEGKMSKSVGNIITLEELKEKGFSPLDYRYLTLTTHYREQLLFSIKNLESSKTALKRAKTICSELKKEKGINKKYLEDFTKALEDDLNLPKALQAMWKLLRDKTAKDKYKTIEKMDEVLGLNLLENKKTIIPKNIEELLEKRKMARKNKDWKESDKLREKIHKLGFQIIDTSEGSKIEKA